MITRIEPDASTVLADYQFRRITGKDSRLPGERQIVAEFASVVENLLEYIERRSAHHGCMSREEIDRELAKMKTVSAVTCAHDSSDIGVTADLDRARTVLAKAKERGA